MIQYNTCPNHSIPCTREELIEHIRSKPGFENFLKPKPFDQLKHAASDAHVVIVNLHHSRCDALILKHEPDELSVQHIPLIDCSVEQMSTLREKMKLSLKQAERNARKPVLDSEHLDNGNTILEGILRDLWLKVVGPVLSALNISVSAFNTLLLHHS